jgi:protease-4
MKYFFDFLKTMFTTINIFIGLFFIGLIGFFLWGSFSVFKTIDLDDNNEKSEIALIKIEGPIMSSQDILKKILKVEKNNQFKALILRIDSPGGAVAPTQEIYEEIKRLDKIKPVYASFGGIAASGGYYIGAATRQIFALKGTITGSIGAIMTFIDASKILNKLDLKIENYKSGKYKDITAPSRSRTEEEKSLLEKSIMNAHEQFVFDILATRASKITGNMADHATGMFFTGQDALERGLIDQIGGLYEVARFIQKEYALKSSDLLEIKTSKETIVTKLLDQLEEKISLKVYQLFFTKVFL